MRSLVSALLLFAASLDHSPSGTRRFGNLKPRAKTALVIFLGGQRVGYSSSNTRTVTRDGQEVLISDTLVAMTIKRFVGVTLGVIVRQSSEEDPKTGRLLEFVVRVGEPADQQDRDDRAGRGKRRLLERAATRDG